MLETQEFGLFINVLIFSTRLGSLLVGGMLENVQLALILFSVSGVLVYGYLNLWLMNLVGISWKKVLRIMTPYLVMCIPVAGSMALLKIFDASEWLVLAVAFAFGVAYLLYLVWTVPQFRAALRRSPLGARIDK